MRYFDNDYELIYMINQHDVLAMQLLIQKYQGIIETVIKNIMYDQYLWQSYRDDLVQQGLITLIDCAQRFIIDRQVKFNSFFSVCLERKIRNQVKSYYSQQGKYVNAISLDASIEGYDDLVVCDNVESTAYELRGDYHMALHQLQEQVNELLEHCDTTEQQIFQLKMAGYSYQEISKKLDCDIKKVDNTVQKVRKKLLTVLA
jgi:RNA polymerase sporulation-specific sigma factor